MTNVNDVVVLGLDEATKKAVAEWEEMGAPLAKGYGESTRANLRAWSPGGPYNTTEVYRLAVHFIEQGKMAEKNAAYDRAMIERRAARQRAREAMTSEMKEIRAAMGLTMEEMNDLLGLKPGMVRNAENAGASYGLDVVEGLLRRYRAAAKAKVGA